MILLETQSVDELLSRLASAKQYQLDNNTSSNHAMRPYASLPQPTTTTTTTVVVVISLSPQSMASLAMLHGLSPPDCARRLATVFKQLGAVAVFDTAWSRDVSLVETAAEFIHRYKQKYNPTTTSTTSTSTTVTRASSSSLLPMLASACPGWVCYAEKTHGSVLPYISSTKSPQAVMGTVVKQVWAAKHGVAPSSIYHVAVMPCYDKKLEAARDDLTTITTTASSTGGGVIIANEEDNNRVAETDCVLATSELQTLLQKVGIADLKAIQPTTTLDTPCTNDTYSNGGSNASNIINNNQPMYGVRGGSGGYLEYIYKTAARELFGIEIGTGPLAMTRGRNADFKEITLDINSGNDSNGNGNNGGGGGKKKVLHFAAAYGFRNIQGLVRKIKTGKCPYDYVEVMACPSGCLNGGGQIKPEDIVRMMNNDDGDGDDNGNGDNSSGGNHRYKNAQEVLDVLDELYHAEGNTLVLRDPEDNPGVRGLYEEVGIQEIGGEESRKVFHTEYHERSQSLASAVKDW